MVKFIDASTVKSKEDKLNQGKVDLLIATLNGKIKEESEEEDSFTVNTGLDNISILTVPEFEEAKKEALNSGWSLTVKPDNYQSYSYKITKI